MTSRSHHKMLELLTRSLPSSPATDGAAEEAKEFDWHSPCCYTLDQLRRLSTLAAQASERLSGAIKGRRIDAAFSPLPVVMEYGEKVSARAEPSFYLSLAGEGSEGAGFLEVLGAEAMDWVARLLGSPVGSRSADRQPSGLEMSLLADIMTVLANEFSSTLRQCHGRAVKASGQIGQAPSPLAGEGAVYCRFLFASASRQDSPVISFVLPCPIVDPVAVGNAETAKKNPEENRQDILARVEQATVSGEVRISNVMVPIADIIALSPGDVLLLDSSIGQGVELLVNGKTLAYGLMSTCQGRKAIQITELATQARKN